MNNKTITGKDIAKRKFRNDFLDFSIMLINGKNTIIFFVAGVIDNYTVVIRGINQGELHLLDIKDKEVYFCDDYSDRYDFENDDYKGNIYEEL